MMHRKLIFTIARRLGTIVSLEGNIASGKTSVLFEMKNLLPNSSVHEEPVDKWRNLAGQNILDLMYQDTKRWGFLFQSYVQLTMFSIHQTVKDKNESQNQVHILERSIYSARYCFVENFKQTKSMADVEIQVVDNWFQFLTAADRCPLNLIVYLRTNPECVYKRILKRARPEERVVSPDYIEQLHALHENWLLPHLREGNAKNLVVSGMLSSRNRPLLPRCPVLVVDATLPWQQVCEQIRSIVVPTILSYTSAHQSYCSN